MRPLNQSPVLPEVPRTTEDKLLIPYLERLTQTLQSILGEMANALNDDLLVMPDWLRLLDEDYTPKVSDRVLLFYPTANRTVTLLDPDVLDPPEPHPLRIVHAGSSNTVTLDPEGSIQIDGSASVALSSGEARTVVPVRQRLVDAAGLGSVEWVTVSTRP